MNFYDSMISPISVAAESAQGGSLNFYDSLIYPISVVVGYILGPAHWFFSLFLDPDSGLTWVLSVVTLVLIMRAVMIPLYVKQIRSSRRMQLVQPEMQKIQKKYKGKTDPVSRQRQQEEMMALYRKHGTNPLSSCWPILLQSPFFFGLFRLLYNLKDVSAGTFAKGTIGPIDQQLATSFEHATMFGAPLSATFLQADQAYGGANPLSVKIVTVILIVLMSVTTFTTQRQLTMKNMPEAAKDNPMFRTQKMMLYVFPLVFAISGVNFPIGVLIYWFTTNLWSMGQQFIVIRRMPTPGSEAERRMQERKTRKGIGVPTQDDGAAEASSPATPAGQRQQPKRTTKAQRTSGQVQAKPSGAQTGGAQAGGAQPGGAQSGEAKSGGAESGAQAGGPSGTKSGGPSGTKPGGAESGGVRPSGAKAGGAKSPGGRAGGKAPGKADGAPSGGADGTALEDGSDDGDSTKITSS